MTGPGSPRRLHPCSEDLNPALPLPGPTLTNVLQSFPHIWCLLVCPAPESQALSKDQLASITPAHFVFSPLWQIRQRQPAGKSLFSSQNSTRNSGTSTRNPSCGLGQSVTMLNLLFTACPEKGEQRGLGGMQVTACGLRHTSQPSQKEQGCHVSQPRWTGQLRWTLR